MLTLVRDADDSHDTVTAARYGRRERLVPMRSETVERVPAKSRRSPHAAGRSSAPATHSPQIDFAELIARVAFANRRLGPSAPKRPCAPMCRGRRSLRRVAPARVSFRNSRSLRCGLYGCGPAERAPWCWRWRSARPRAAATGPPARAAAAAATEVEDPTPSRWVTTSSRRRTYGNAVWRIARFVRARETP